MRGPLEILYNFYWIEPGEAARSAHRPAILLAPLLRANGIRAVVNLRGYHPHTGWWKREQRVCDRIGIRRFDLMLDSRKLPTRTMLVSLLEAFDASPRPFLVKCAGGQDRTGLAAALYILHTRGWGARDKALLQFSAFPYLHFPARQQRWLKVFPDYAQEAARGRPLLEWLREEYDPHALAAWLSANGLSKGFSEVFLRQNERIRLG